MKHQYEAVVLYHPDLEKDLDKASKKVEEILTAAGGKITKTENWGRRKLAYSVSKQQHAVYVLYYVDIEAGKIAKVEKNLNITDGVLRYLITRPDAKAQAKAEAAKAELAKKQTDKNNDDNNDDKI